MVEHLFAQDMLVSGLCYPNTPEGESLIRITPTVDHSDTQIDALVSAIDQGQRLLE
jgi:7-keto-8-aminopelargonate synthetase-like enzyme